MGGWGQGFDRAAVAIPSTGVFNQKPKALNLETPGSVFSLCLSLSLSLSLQYYTHMKVRNNYDLSSITLYCMCYTIFTNTKFCFSMMIMIFVLLFVLHTFLSLVEDPVNPKPETVLALKTL